MNQIKRPLVFVSVGIAALFIAAAAHADSFTLTYTFGGGSVSSGPGTTLEATFDGTLAGNLITNISNASVSVDGSSWGTVYGYGVTSSGWTLGAEVLSVDGTENNFLFADTSNPMLGAFSFYFASLTGSASLAYANGAEWLEIYRPTPRLYALDESFQFNDGNSLNSTWTVTNNSVPEGGATLALLGGALLGIAALRRRFVG